MRAVVVVAVAAVACGTVKGMMSNVESAKVTCDKCQPGMTVGVGAPFNLRVDWDRCSDVDPKCDANLPPFKIVTTCEGIECRIDDTGGGYFEITPTAPGTASVVVQMKDQKRREERFGPFTAAVVDAIDITCTFIRPGGDSEPCTTSIPAGSDIYLEIVARAGDRRVATPVPRDVVVDGRPVFVEGQPTGGGGWGCKASSLSTDPAVPSITRCHLVQAAPGAKWTVEARLPQLKLAARATIAVGAK